MNKLHVISGLLQIGETQKAIAFINGVSEDVEDNYQGIIRQLHNRTVAALVLGKASHARELVIIVGNLVENAFEAVKAAPLKQVRLFIGEDAHGLTITVDDTGHGMTEEQIAADTGLFKVTVRRYLNYLIGTNEAESQVDYSTGGRPRVEYRSL